MNKDGIEDIVIQETLFRPSQKGSEVRETVLYGANREGKIVYLTEEP